MRHVNVLVAITTTFGVPTAAQADGAWVNVSEQWCGGTCSEGHNSTECICTRWDSGACQGSKAQSCWISCQEVECCNPIYWTEWCDLGCTVGRGCGEIDPDTSPPAVRCSTNGRESCLVYEGETGCWVDNKIGMEANYIWVNGMSGAQCTGANETGTLATCTRSGQSPWDDDQFGVVCD